VVDGCDVLFQSNANLLAYEVGMAVYQMAGGVGESPQLPS